MFWCCLSNVITRILIEQPKVIVILMKLNKNISFVVVLSFPVKQKYRMYINFIVQKEKVCWVCLLGMLDSVIECSPWHIEVAFLNFPNLFVENDYIDYSVLSDTHNKMLRHGEWCSSPGIISQVQYSDYNDDAYYAIKKHIKLLRNVRW